MIYLDRNDALPLLPVVFRYVMMQVITLSLFGVAALALWLVARRGAPLWAWQAAYCVSVLVVAVVGLTRGVENWTTPSSCRLDSLHVNERNCTAEQLDFVRWMTLRYVHMCDSQHSLEQQYVANVTVRDVGPAHARSYWAQPATPAVNTSALVGADVECFVDRYRQVFFEFDLDALLDVCLAVVSLMQCFLAATCSAWLFMPENKASVDLRLDGSLPQVNIDRKALRASLIEQALGRVARDAPEREQKCVAFVDLLLAMRLQHIEYSVTCRASRWFESIGETFTHHKLRFRLQRPCADETPAELEPFAQSLDKQALIYELCGAAGPHGSRLQHRLSLGAWKVGSARAAKQAAPVHLRDGDEDPLFSFTDGRWSFSSLAAAVENGTHRAEMQVPYRWATEDESSLNCQVCVQRVLDHLQLQPMQLLSSSDHMMALRSTAAASPVSGLVQRGRFARTGLVCLLFELACVLLPLYGTTLYYFRPALDAPPVEHALLLALLYVLGAALILVVVVSALCMWRRGAWQWQSNAPRVLLLLCCGSILLGGFCVGVGLSWSALVVGKEAQQVVQLTMPAAIGGLAGLCVLCAPCVFLWQYRKRVKGMRRARE
jgi:hypothetical protein